MGSVGNVGVGGVVELGGAVELGGVVVELGGAVGPPPTADALSDRTARTRAMACCALARVLVSRATASASSASACDRKSIDVARRLSPLRISARPFSSSSRASCKYKDALGTCAAPSSSAPRMAAVEEATLSWGGRVVAQPDAINNTIAAPGRVNFMGSLLRRDGRGWLRLEQDELLSCHEQVAPDAHAFTGAVWSACTAIGGVPCPSARAVRGPWTRLCVEIVRSRVPRHCPARGSVVERRRKHVRTKWEAFRIRGVPIKLHVSLLVFLPYVAFVFALEFLRLADVTIGPPGSRPSPLRLGVVLAIALLPRSFSCRAAIRVSSHPRRESGSAKSIPLPCVRAYDAGEPLPPPSSDA
jgi:hypothetical protein